MTTPKPLDTERNLLLAALGGFFNLSDGELRSMGVTDIVERSLASTWKSALDHAVVQVQSARTTSVSGLFTKSDLYDDGDRKTPVQDEDHRARLAHEAKTRR